LIFAILSRKVVIDIYLNHIYSINLEKATAWPFPYSQKIANLIKRRHWALKELYNKEGTTIIYRVTQGT
jgi:hypothetical protein